LVAWARIPNYQLSSQLRLFLYYGKPGLTATEANPSSAWRGYLAVIDSRTGADRTGNGRSLTPSGITAGELIGPAGSFNGSAVASRSDAAFLSGLGAVTVQAVVQANAAMVGSDHGILAQGPMNGTDAAAGVTLQYLAKAADGSANVVQFKLNCTDGGTTVLSEAQAQSSSRQVLHGVWSQGGTARLFLNGDEAEPSTSPIARAGLSAMPAGGFYLGSGARDPATGGWRGLIDDVRIAAVAVTSARVAAEAANLAAAQALYGLGGEDAPGESDAAPAAVPVRATATSGGSVEVDVLTGVYDPDGPLPISVAGVGTARNGVVTVVSGKVRYTPFAGFTGTDDFTYTVKSGSKRSDSVVTVTVVPPASASELPAARRTINVASAAQLTAALGGNFSGLVTTPASASGPLVAGDQIVLADGTYGGTFALARSGTAPTDGNRNGVPIVVRAASLLGARFTGKFNVSGINGWLYGLDFDGQNANGAIGSNLGGDHSRLMRCRYRRHRTDAAQGGGSIVVMLAAKYNKVWYCEFTDFDGRPISSKTTESPALYPHIYRCHWHDNVAPPAASDGNGRECLQLGQTQGDGVPVRTPIRGLVEHNLLKNCYVGTGHDESEPFSNKSSTNIYRYNTFDSLKNYLTIRFGLDCEVYGNYFTNCGGIVVYGDRHRIIGNVITGTTNPRRIRVFAGTQTMELDEAYLHPNGPTAPDAGNMVGFTPWGERPTPTRPTSRWRAARSSPATAARS
jgi:hypothetical protein